MVYFFTSGNVKMLRNIIIDYGAANELSAYEYMKNYIEKCPENTEDSKLSWIAETFLGIQKHGQFLKEIVSTLSEELTEEDQDYFMILFHAVSFQIPPTDMQLLYKCLFNLNKSLLSTFTKFLSNNEVLTFISHIAQTSYDTNYITEKIIGPLFVWQPYISEMAHSYAEYVKKVQSRKLKPLTVPIQPNVLNRKGKDTSPLPAHSSLPATPPNSLRTKSRKMLTKSAIDRRLKNIHEKNQQKALHLLNNVKSTDFHFAQPKSEKYYNRVSNLNDKVDNEFIKTLPKPKPKFVVKNKSPVVKETAATIKRMNKRIQMTEREEVEWLQDLLKCCRNPTKVEEIGQAARQENERQRLLDVERKHLLGQISHEEAVIAKKKVEEINKKKYEEFLKEKEIWNEEIEKWKRDQIAQARIHYESISMIELNIIEAKTETAKKKKEIALKLKKESEMIIAEAMKVKQEELNRRIKMIKEINILSMIARKARVPKIVDLTETSGLGLLCEMSIAELQERLSAMKMSIKEEIERKKKTVREQNDTAKQELEDVKNYIKDYIMERATLRKLNKNSSAITAEAPTSKELSDLKKVLEEKRRLRIKLTN